LRRAALRFFLPWLALAGCVGDDDGFADDAADAVADEAAGEAPIDVPDEAFEDGGSDAADDGAADDAAEAEAEEPWVAILFPADGESVPNPVTFLFDAGGGVETVEFEADGWPLQSAPIPVAVGELTYEFGGVNFARHVVLTGFDATGAPVATDALDFTPTEELCPIPDAAGFNHYTIAAINDWTVFPKDETYPYCWSAEGDTCAAPWGQIHDGYYAGERLFPGANSCFCSGHTLEIFLRAYRVWQESRAIPETAPFAVGGSVLTVDDVDIGPFYQYWQGFGVTSEASSADAFVYAGIGEEVTPDRWDEALPGDYVNLSRSTGSGHAVIFVSWIVEESEKVGLRYYGCQHSGDSCPDPDDPLCSHGNSGPSFVTERFSGHGGTVLPSYLFIGRVYEPTTH